MGDTLLAVCDSGIIGFPEHLQLAIEEFGKVHSARSDPFESGIQHGTLYLSGGKPFHIVVLREQFTVLCGPFTCGFRIESN